MEFQKGTTFATFKLVELLGRGAMGVVYRATQESLDRDVALKLIHPGVDRTCESELRFLREGLIQGRLQHPGLTRVLDAGIFSGTSYLVTEYMDGGSLKHLLDSSGTLRWSRLGPLFLSLCEALDHLHESGILHRDLKPANILLTREGRCALADFGLAKAPELTQITEAGQILGTLFYAAPEVLTGEAAGPGSDVYSLGMSAYHALAGKLPHATTTPVAWVDAVTRRPPSPDPLDEVGVPRRARNVIMAMLDPRPGKRPTSHEVMDEISRMGIRASRFTSGEDSRAPRPAIVSTADEPRGRWTLRSVLGILVIFITGLGLWVAPRRHRDEVCAVVASLGSLRVRSMGGERLEPELWALVDAGGRRLAPDGREGSDLHFGGLEPGTAYSLIRLHFLGEESVCTLRTLPRLSDSVTLSCVPGPRGSVELTMHPVVGMDLPRGLRLFARGLAMASSGESGYQLPPPGPDHESTLSFGIDGLEDSFDSGISVRGLRPLLKEMEDIEPLVTTAFDAGPCGTLFPMAALDARPDFSFRPAAPDPRDWYERLRRCLPWIEASLTGGTIPAALEWSLVTRLTSLTKAEVLAASEGRPPLGLLRCMRSKLRIRLQIECGEPGAGTPFPGGRPVYLLPGKTPFMAALLRDPEELAVHETQLEGVPSPRDEWLGLGLCLRYEKESVPPTLDLPGRSIRIEIPLPAGGQTTDPVLESRLEVWLQDRSTGRPEKIHLSLRNRGDPAHHQGVSVRAVTSPAGDVPPDPGW